MHPYRRSPYFFLLASALLRSFASRIESETTRFNRNPYQPVRGQQKPCPRGVPGSREEKAVSR
ncbi:hypothetical protein DVJ83_13045 [Deinococcus wulumuqiensis]|uniref:Uncharacterized protein n=1 Tax=Deinococcus wulumuqiensis TaxID=980427 RepID=A0A345IJM1_9DEIO|nr:hypothetical protein DVJ83_13045 [Deinococcus wulumuqiensis]